MVKLVGSACWQLGLKVESKDGFANGVSLRRKLLWDKNPDIGELKDAEQLMVEFLKGQWTRRHLSQSNRLNAFSSHSKPRKAPVITKRKI